MRSLVLMIAVATPFGAYGLNSTASLCNGASVVSPESNWVWSTSATPSPSCTIPQVVNKGQMCEGDPTSVVIQASGQAECLATHMDDCGFNMHDLDQLDFDVNMVGCRGTWAAPLWMSPDSWIGPGPSSGEIDMLENCPWDQVRSNFAGDGAGDTQVSWTQGSYIVGTADDFKSHTTLWKQQGDIYVKTCRQTEVGSDGTCSQDGAAHLPDILGKNGCTQGDCTYHMISDIWNGKAGDDGWVGCTQSSTNYGSQCKFSVTNIKTKGVRFSGKCAVLMDGSPTPPPTPPPPAPPPSTAACSAHPACSGLTGDCCPTTDGVTLDCCGSQPTPSPPTPPPTPPSGAACSAHPACSKLAGDCCPTRDGVMLDCCSSSSQYEIV